MASFIAGSLTILLKYFVEVGLGGRLDATNIINPILSVITNIGFDHTQFLGNTLVSIAKEKAGIIKENVPVVIGETQSEIVSVFQERSNLLKAPITFADAEEICSHQSDLKGLYQSKNIQTAVVAVNKLGRLVFLSEFSNETYS